MKIALVPTVNVPGDKPLVHPARDRAPVCKDPITHSEYFLIDGRQYWRPCDRIAVTEIPPDEWPYPPEEGYEEDWDEIDE